MAIRYFGLVAVIAAVLLVGSPALAGVRPRDARIAGRVLVCNGPGRCFARLFSVSAINSKGRVVEMAETRSSNNDYALRVAPGSYKLEADSSGLKCYASAVAKAHQTTHRDITCLVP